MYTYRHAAKSQNTSKHIYMGHAPKFKKLALYGPLYACLDHQHQVILEEGK